MDICWHSTYWWGIMPRSFSQTIKVNPQKSAGHFRMWFTQRDGNKKANIQSMKMSLFRFDPRFLLPHFVPSPSSSKGTGYWRGRSVPGDGKKRCQCSPSCSVSSPDVPWVLLCIPQPKCVLQVPGCYFWDGFHETFQLFDMFGFFHSIFFNAVVLGMESCIFKIYINFLSDICCKFSLFPLNYLNLLVRNFMESKREGMQAQKKEWKMKHTSAHTDAIKTELEKSGEEIKKKEN